MEPGRNQSDMMGIRSNASASFGVFPVAQPRSSKFSTNADRSICGSVHSMFSINGAGGRSLA